MNDNKKNILIKLFAVLMLIIFCFLVVALPGFLIQIAMHVSIGRAIKETTEGVGWIFLIIIVISVPLIIGEFILTNINKKLGHEGTMFLLKQIAVISVIVIIVVIGEDVVMVISRSFHRNEWLFWPLGVTITSLLAMWWLYSKRRE